MLRLHTSVFPLGKQLPVLVLDTLTCLKSKSGVRINIIDEIAPHWIHFSLKLGISGPAVLGIEKKWPYDERSCCREVMEMWLIGKGRQPPTWELLVKTLQECDDELSSLAERINQAITL